MAWTSFSYSGVGFDAFFFLVYGIRGLAPRVLSSPQESWPTSLPVARNFVQNLAVSLHCVSLCKLFNFSVPCFFLMYKVALIISSTCELLYKILKPCLV